VNSRAPSCAQAPGRRSWKDNPGDDSRATHLLFCSKNVERIGDHATNTAETVFYLVTGETLPSERLCAPLLAASQCDHERFEPKRALYAAPFVEPIGGFEEIRDKVPQ
jgi:hypothetical protein